MNSHFNLVHLVQPIESWLEFSSMKICQRKFFPTLDCFKCIKSCSNPDADASQFSFPRWSLGKFFPTEQPLNWRGVESNLYFETLTKARLGNSQWKTILFIYHNFNWTQSFYCAHHSRISFSTPHNSEMEKLIDVKAVATNLNHIPSWQISRVLGFWSWN